MAHDIEQWRGVGSSSVLSDIDRWIVRMGIGYFSGAEGIVGDNIHDVQELVTASESQARARPPRARGEHPR